jgi:hypothetical protein
MSFFFREEATGAARTSSVQEAASFQSQQLPPRQKTAVGHAGELLSERAASFMEMIARGRKPRTVDEYRKTLWYIFEFVSCDCPARELGSDTAQRFLDWLTDTPIAPRKSKTLPERFSPQSVAAFFAWPPRRTKTETLRQEVTILRYWHQSKPFFDFLGLPTHLDRDQRPSAELPPPAVPGQQAIAAWWRDMLTASSMPESSARKRRFLPQPAERRRVVLIQAFLYLTGLRMEEALIALRADVEGHWLLVRPGKTNMAGIIYLNRQALGIVAALHADRQLPLFDADTGSGAKFLLGWPQTQSTWQALVRACTSRERYVPHEDRNQAMRKKLSTWMHRRDATSESAQLRHGKGVVFTNYLDYLRPLPKLLEKRRLPAVELEGFQWPPLIAASRARPDRLFALFRQIVNDLRRQRRRQR